MPARPKLVDPGQLIRAAKRRTETYHLCTDPGLVAEREALLDRMTSEPATTEASLAGRGAAKEARAQLEELDARGAAATVSLVFQSLPRPRFRALVDAHRPRKDEAGEVIDPRSRQLGVEYDEFFAALIPQALTSPALDEETLTHLVEEVLTDRQWRDVCTVAWNLNQSDIDVPFLPAVSAKIPRSLRT